MLAEEWRESLSLVAGLFLGCFIENQVDHGGLIDLLHKGPYADETATIAAMDAFAKEHHLKRNGYHHEIYLTDPNRTAPEKMRTILRQPVKAE